MTNNATISPSTSPAAERMRCHRQRRRDGFQSLLVELRATVELQFRGGAISVNPSGMDAMSFWWRAPVVPLPALPASSRQTLQWRIVLRLL